MDDRERKLPAAQCCLIPRAVVLLAVCAALLGCGDSPETGPRARRSGSSAPPTKASKPSLDLALGKAAPSADAWTAAHTDRVQQACNPCHLAPPADALPRGRWRDVIVSMGDMPPPPGRGPAGTPSLTADDAVLAVAYYERHAPVELERLKPAPAASIKFRVEHRSPNRGPLAGSSIPAVAHVSFVPLNAPPRLDLVVSEMRSGTVMVYPPWAPGPQRKMVPLFGQMNYPVKTIVQDFDADGRLDFLVAGLGDMNPSNHTRGSVLLARSTPQRKFVTRPLVEGCARPADVRAADLDLDGDLDFIVSEFGFRGPGLLRLFQNRPNRQGEINLHETRQDARDGFVQVEVTDLDRDGLPDIVGLLAQEHEEVVVFLNRGGFRFEPRILHKAPHPAWGYSAMQLVDLDGDGDEDLLLCNGDALDDNELKPYHGVRWLEQRGPLDFVEHRILALYGCERAVAADLDGDGDQDVVAASFLPQMPESRWRELSLDSVVWAEQTGEGWRVQSLERLRCLHPTLAVADYDLDGKQDIALGNYVWLQPDGKPLQRAHCVTIMTQQ